jgi:hypothetical protein
MDNRQRPQRQKLAAAARLGQFLSRDAPAPTASRLEAPEKAPQLHARA